MGSEFLDTGRLAAHERFEFDFPGLTLRGKTIVAAGGAGGLGAATVALLAQEGARVVIAYQRNRERAEKLAATLNGRAPGDVHTVGGDLRSAEGRDRLLEAAARLTGEIYALVSFLGDPARVDSSALNESALQDSLASN